MRSSVFWALVRKDMYVLRIFAVAEVVSGLLAVGAMLIGNVGFAIGGILYLTANVAGAIMIAMHNFVVDRKEQTRVFALSLPISGQQHDFAKLTGAFLTYGLPWTVLTLVGVLVLPLAGVFPRGFLVYGALVQGCCLALFSLIVAALFVVVSEAMAGLVIITCNLLFSLFMVAVSQPSVSSPLHGPQIVWTGTALALLAAELGVIVLSLVFAISVILRRRDHL
jgi:ABC-2 type transport system permease protein